MPVARRASTAKTAVVSERDRKRQHIGGEMIVAGGEQHGGRIAAHGEQASVAERGQAGIADQHVERERQDGPDQDLAGDVDVVGVADPDRQRREQRRGPRAMAARAAA